ncbi:MAG TPA: hypothetical protein VNS22_14900 [Geminicoccus sp.]|uniref:hypothetical protein n=1 Tax=Geminicoccus sp. TaxID=2024832 RepID=UPI002CE635B8|nr:hypothetical protein [Geminicoccus sp.]HWL69658.1 hypothetical protein [Geminicoccus sp.]
MPDTEADVVGRLTKAEARELANRLLEPDPDWIEPLTAARSLLDQVGEAIRVSLAALDHVEIAATRGKMDPGAREMGISTLVPAVQPPDVAKLALLLAEASATLVAPERGLARDPDLIKRRARMNLQENKKWKNHSGRLGWLKTPEMEEQFYRLVDFLGSRVIRRASLPP